MADAADSKSAMVYPCVGSSPTSGTNLPYNNILRNPGWRQRAVGTITRMGLKMYCRHRPDREAGHSENSRPGPFEESRRRRFEFHRQP